MNYRRVAALVGLLLLLATTTLLSNMGGSAAALDASARSVEWNGRRAAFLLLEELGFEPELWDARPGELAAEAAAAARAGGSPGLLWMPAAPRSFDPLADPEDPLEAARARGLSAWSHYRRFAESGGVLVLPASEESLEFLTAGLGLDRAPGEPFKLLGKPEVGAGLRVGAPDEAAPVREAGTEALFDAGDRLVSLRVPLGAGAVVLVAGGTWLDNGKLDTGERGLLLVRLVERHRDGGPLRFDEQALSGSRGGGSALQLAFGGGRIFTWHLLALLGLLVWWQGWSREFPRDPEPHETLSPLLRASSTSALLVRHGRFDALAEMLRAGTLERLGGASVAGPGASSVAVAELARRHGRADEVERWIEMLVTRPVADVAGLVALDLDLRALEAQDTGRVRERAAPEQE